MLTEGKNKLFSSKYKSFQTQNELVEKLISLPSSDSFLPYVPLCSTTGVGKTKLLLEMLYGITSEETFNSVRTTFPNIHYISLAANGSFPTPFSIPDSLTSSYDCDSSDPMIIGLEWLYYLLQIEFDPNSGKFLYKKPLLNAMPGTARTEEAKRCNTIIVTELLNKLKELLTKENKNGNALLALDEAHLLFNKNYLHHYISPNRNEIGSFNLLTLLRIAASYFNHINHNLKIVIIVSSTSSSIFRFLPSTSKQQSNFKDESTTFRSVEYDEFFTKYRTLDIFVFSSFKTYHLLDENDPYTHGRPLWARERSNTGFFTFVIKKLLGGQKEYGSFMKNNMRVQPKYKSRGLLMSLLFHRVSLLDPSILAISPDIIGKHCVPSSHFDLKSGLFAISSPEEPVLAAASAYLLQIDPVLQKDVLNYLMNLDNPSPSEKGNIGELVSLFCFLLKVDSYCIDCINQPIQLEDFFNQRIKPVSLIDFLKYLHLEIPTKLPDYYKNITFSVISFRRALFTIIPQMEAACHANGSGAYFPANTMGQDAIIVMKDESTNLCFSVFVQIKNLILAPNPDPVFKNIIAHLNAKLKILISYDTKGKSYVYYDTAEKILLIYLRFQDLGVPEYQSLPISTKSKPDFGDLHLPTEEEFKNFEPVDPWKIAPWDLNFICNSTQIARKTIVNKWEGWVRKHPKSFDLKSHLHLFEYQNLLSLRSFYKISSEVKRKDCLIEAIAKYVHFTQNFHYFFMLFLLCVILTCSLVAII